MHFLIQDVEDIRTVLAWNPGGSFTLRAGFCWRSDSRSRTLFRGRGPHNAMWLSYASARRILVSVFRVPCSVFRFSISPIFFVCSFPYLDVPLGGDVDTPVYLGRMTEKR